MSRAKTVSKKQERVTHLIALHDMLAGQSRKKDGSATFNERQLSAALESLESVLALDHIVKAE